MQIQKTNGSETQALEHFRIRLDDELQRNHFEISERVAGYFRQEVPLLRMFFPTKLQKLVKDAELREAKTELEFKQALLSRAIDFELEAIHEKYEVWAKVLKVQFRFQFSEFVTAREAELRQTIDQRREGYLEGAQKRQELYEKYRGLQAAEHFRNSIETEDQEYFLWLDRILTNFRSIVEERIKKFEAAS